MSAIEYLEREEKEKNNFLLFLPVSGLPPQHLRYEPLFVFSTNAQKSLDYFSSETGFSAILDPIDTFSRVFGLLCYTQALGFLYHATKQSSFVLSASR